MKRLYKSISFLFILILSSSLYAQAPDFAWATGMGGTEKDVGNSIDVNDSGNVYSTGYFKGTADFGKYTLNSTKEAAYVCKQDPNGTFLWATKITANLSAQGLSIAADDSGNTYVTGYFVSTSVDIGSIHLTTPYNPPYGAMFIAKFDNTGQVVWAKLLTGKPTAWQGGKPSSKGNSIAVDKKGFIYVTGYFVGQGSIGSLSFNAYNDNEDVFVCKLNSNGNALWCKVIGGAGKFNVGNSIYVDNSNVYVGGNFEDTLYYEHNNANIRLFVSSQNGKDRNFFVCKLDKQGNYIWAKNFGEGSKSRTLNGLVVDNNGNVYSTGHYQGTCTIGTTTLTNSGDYDIFINKLDSLGNYVWAKKVGGKGMDQCLDMAIDSSSNIYFVGDFSRAADFDPGSGVHNLKSTLKDDDAFICKLDSKGALVWATNFGAVPPSKPTIFTMARSVTVDKSGGVYTTGQFLKTVDFNPGTGIKDTANLTTKGNYDIFVQKLAATCANPNFAKASANNPICVGDSLKLSSTAGGKTYNWTGSNGFSSNNQNPFVTNVNLSDSGIYKVVIDNGNCIDSATVNVIIVPSPTASASSNSPICSGKTLKLQSNGGGTYSWTGPNGFNSAQQNPSISNTKVPASGKYIVTVTNGNGCSNRDTVSVTITPGPKVNTSYNDPLCIDNTLNLKANGGTSYQWTGPNRFSSNQQNPSIPNANTSASGNYIVTVTDNNGCISIDTLKVTINTSSTIHIISPSSDTAIYSGGQIILKAQGVPSGGNYLWKPSNEVDCPTCQTTNAHPSKTTIYIVKYVDTMGCIGYDSVKVTLQSSCSLAVPTAFSPNGDGFNDKLKTYGLGGCEVISFQFLIYNRYGQIVFRTVKPNDSWDGTMNDKELNPGVFTYYTKVLFGSGDSKELKGNVTLIK